MNKAGLWGVLGTLALVLVGGVIAYVWLPQVQRDPEQSLFAAWCSALGVPKSWLSSKEPALSSPSSEVVLNHELLGSATASDVHAGGELAQGCAGCHGPTPISFPNSPNLAGQYAIVVYKQLRDFKSGIRTHAIMSGMAAPLSDGQMRQLAAYYASLPRPAAAQLTGSPPDIVKWGAPMRNIAPCGSCHGDVDHTIASPWLKGQPEDYIRAQLTAFGSGERHNDINGQMRAMAHGLKPEEIAQAAAYYSEPKK